MSTIGNHKKLNITKKQMLEYLFELIIIDISLKGKALHKAMEGRMSHLTFYKMINDDEEKLSKYARACEERADVIFEESLEIADAKAEDIIMTEDGPQINIEHINRTRLRIETRKWFLAKLKPKKYGDKIDVTTDNKELPSNNIIFIPLNNHENTD